MQYSTSKKIFNSLLDNYQGLNKTAWQAIFLVFLESIACGISLFLSIYFVTILHLDDRISGLLLSFYGLGTIIGSAIAGRLADKISPKKISIISLIIQGLNYFILIYLKNINVLALVLFLIGFTSYSFSTANNVWMLNQINDDKVRLKAINLSRVALNLGFTLSGLLFFIFNSQDFKIIFFVAGFCLITSGFYLLLQKEIYLKKAFENEINTVETKINNQLIFFILLWVFFIGLVIAQLSVTYPLYIQNQFPILGIKAVSILFMLDTLLIVFLQPPLVNVLGSFNKINLVGLGALLIGLGMLILKFTVYFTIAILSSILISVGEMIFLSVTQLICFDCSSNESKGKNSGNYQTSWAMSKILGPALGSYYYHFQNGNLWLLCFLIGFFCFISCRYYSHLQIRTNTHATS